MSTTTYADDYDDYQVTPANKNVRARRITNALVVLICIGAAFYGGVYMEKHHGASTTSTVTRPAFAGARTGTGTGTATGTATGAAPTAGATGAAGTFGNATTGSVTVVDGNDFYVTTAAGNTVKVAASSSSTISKSTTGTINDIKPGDTVTVRGAAGDDGTVAATSISVGNTGATAR